MPRIDWSSMGPGPSTPGFLNAGDLDAAHDTDAEREAFVPSRLSDSALKAAFGGATVGPRLRRAAAAAFRRNGVELGLHPAPPTLTTGTTNLDATLTNSANYIASGIAAAKYLITGGIPVPNGTGNITAYSVTRPSGTGGNTSGNGGTKQTYQWAVEFVTDAPKVQIRHAGTSSTYMIEVDDQPISATALVHAATAGGTVYALLDFGTSTATHKVRIEYQASSSFGQVDVGPTYSVWAPSDEHSVRVCTVGDSVDGGTGAVLAAGAWSKYLGKLLGWADVRQVSYGGTGFTNNAGTLNTFGSALRVSDVVAHSPDLLIISASQNDDASTAAAITAAALAAFRAYRTALPGVPIVVMGADAGSSGPSATRLANSAAVKAAFDTWADSRSWWVPNCADPSGSWQSGTGTTGGPTGTGNRDRFGFDASHPNDAGHRYLGQRAAAAFRALVLPNV